MSRPACPYQKGIGNMILCDAMNRSQDPLAPYGFCADILDSELCPEGWR